MRKRDEAKFALVFLSLRSALEEVRDDVFANCSARVASCARIAALLVLNWSQRWCVFTSSGGPDFIAQRAQETRCMYKIARPYNKHAHRRERRKDAQLHTARRLIKVSTRAAIRIYRGTLTSRSLQFNLSNWASSALCDFIAAARHS